MGSGGKCGYASYPRVGRDEGALDLGPWEQVFYAEFDGRWRKRVLVKIIEE